MARASNATITLLHVMPQPPAIYSELRRREVDVQAVLNSTSELGRNLRREQQLLTALGIQVEVRLRQGLVLEEIVDEIRGGGYDLVVAGSSLSMGPLRTYVLGNVTRQIIDQAEGSVVVARHAQKPPRLKQRLRELFQGFSFSAGDRPQSPGAK
jgi:nucleotide-binding universal stress UspA family protein